MRAALLVLLLASPALAGDALEQARELASRGKLDEAERTLDAAIPGLSGAAKRDARRLKADVTRRRPDRAAFERARALYEELAREDEEDLETRWQLYESFSERGQRLLEASKRVDDPAPLVREAREIFLEGAALLEAEWTALDAKGTEAAESALVACGFYWPRCLAGAGHAAEDKALLEKAVEKWLAYGERFGSRPEGCESATDLAEVLLELGRLDEALPAVESGLFVAELDPSLPGGLLEVFERGSLVKARLLLAKRDAKAALAAAERGLGAAKKGAAESGLRRLLEIERAEAEAHCGNDVHAIDELQRIAAGTDAAADEALDRIARMTGTSVPVASERLLAQMNQAFERSQPRLALVHARSALAASRREGKKLAAAQALEGMGRALEAEKRGLEAAIAYEEAATAGSDDLARAAALGLVRCTEARRARDPGKLADAACERALALLERRDPGARKGLAPFLLARQLQDQGRFAEAASAYDQVAPEAGTIHDEALLGAARCLYAAEKRDLAGIEKRLRALLARPRSEAQERARPLLAEVLLEDGKAAEVIALLDGTRASTLPWRVRAHVRLGHLDEAEALARALTPGRPAADACRELAVALDKKSATLAPAERRALRARIAPFYASWLEHASARETVPIATECFTLALDVLGLPEHGGFVIELDGPPRPEAKPLLEIAARGFESALGRSRERWRLLAFRAQALGFAGDWKPASEAFSAFAAETKLLDAQGELDPTVAAKNPILLAYLADMGVCELAAGDARGSGHLASVVATAREASRLWWQARLALLRAAERTGSAESLGELKLALRALARKYPGFAEAKELAPRFLELAKKYE